jgi:hypothetical protein
MPLPDAVPALGPLVPPPAREIEVLWQLAQIGNMRSLRLRADHVESLDPAYRPFAQHLRGLADRFQSAAILAFVSRYRADEEVT